MESPISHKKHAEAHSDNEVSHIADEASSSDPKWPDQRHGSSHHGGNETGCPKQFANSQTAAIRPHGGKSGKDIGASISEGKESDTGEAFTQTKYTGQGAQVDTQEVACRNANGTEEQRQPQDKDNKCKRLCICEAAVIELEVGK